MQKDSCVYIHSYSTHQTKLFSSFFSKENFAITHEQIENADPTTNEWNYSGIVYAKYWYVRKSFSFLFYQLKFKLKIFQIKSRTAYSATMLVFLWKTKKEMYPSKKSKKNARRGKLCDSLYSSTKFRGERVLFQE